MLTVAEAHDKDLLFPYYESHDYLSIGLNVDNSRNLLVTYHKRKVDYLKINMNQNQKREPDPKLRKLYPHLTDEKLIAAEDNIERYLEVCLRIYYRTHPNPITERILENLTAKREVKDGNLSVLELYEFRISSARPGFFPLATRITERYFIRDI